MDLTQHIIEHEILGISSSSGGAVKPINYWGYQEFDSIDSTLITLTENDNAVIAVTDLTNIIDGTAVITNTKGKPVYTGVIPLINSKVKVTEHNGVNVTLSAIPSNSYAPFRIWFLLRGIPPDGYTEAPKFVTNQFAEFLEATYINQYGDKLYGTIDANNNRIINLPKPDNDSEPLRKGDLKDYPLRWYIDTFVPGDYINQAPSVNGFSEGQQVAVNDWGHEYNGNIYRVQNDDTWLLLEEAYKGLGVLDLSNLTDYYYAGENDNSWWNDNLVNKQDKIPSAVENNIATWDNNGNTKDSGKSFDDSSLTNDINKIPTSSVVYTALENHITDTNNPHNVTLEQARSQDNQIDGDIDFNLNKAINLPSPSSNNEPLIYGNRDELWFYDTLRNKVQGVTTLHMRYARNSNSITSSQYLRMINGTATNNNSDRLPWNATLIAVIMSQNNTDAAWDVQIRKNRDTTDIYTNSLVVGDEYVIDNQVNIDFDAEDLIQVRLKVVSGTILYPVVQLIFRRRP